MENEIACNHEPKYKWKAHNHNTDPWYKAMMQAPGSQHFSAVEVKGSWWRKRKANDLVDSCYKHSAAYVCPCNNRAYVSLSHLHWHQETMKHATNVRLNAVAKRLEEDPSLLPKVVKENSASQWTWTDTNTVDSLISPITQDGVSLTYCLQCLPQDD